MTRRLNLNRARHKYLGEERVAARALGRHQDRLAAQLAAMPDTQLELIAAGLDLAVSLVAPLFRQTICNNKDTKQ